MMTDADGLLAARFAATRDTYNDADWNDVLLRRPPRRTRARALLVAAAIVAAIAVVALATPLGAAIVHGVGGFSAWLTGQPGSPVSRPEQRAFDRANSRSWLGFPVGTKLRRLVTVSDLPHGRTVDLLGFRSGSTLCLQIVVSGKTRTSTMSCAPLAELRHSISQVHPVLVDSSFGKGTKRAWYGVDRYQATAIQVTAGIAADGVRNVIVEDDSGRHTLRAESNAFLYVASDPEVGQRITHIWARTAKALVPVPFAPAPFGFGGGVTEQGEAIAGPTKVERDVRNGTIGWLDRREPRGEPLDVLLSRAEPSIIRRHAVFGRVLAPDPSLPVRLAVTLSTSRHGGKATGLCSWLIRQGGSGGGCAVRADLFAENPITADTSLMSGSDEFETVSGLASDDVSEIEAFFASGPSIQVPLADNAFIVNVPRARLPFRQRPSRDRNPHSAGHRLRRAEPRTGTRSTAPARGVLQPSERRAQRRQVDRRRALHLCPLRHRQRQRLDDGLSRGHQGRPRAPARHPRAAGAVRDGAGALGCGNSRAPLRGRHASHDRSDARFRPLRGRHSAPRERAPARRSCRARRFGQDDRLRALRQSSQLSAPRTQ